MNSLHSILKVSGIGIGDSLSSTYASSENFLTFSLGRKKWYLFFKKDEEIIRISRYYKKNKYEF